MERFRPGVLELSAKIVKLNCGVADVFCRDVSVTLAKGNKMEGSKERRSSYQSWERMNPSSISQERITEI